MTDPGQIPGQIPGPAPGPPPQAVQVGLGVAPDGRSVIVLSVTTALGPLLLNIEPAMAEQVGNAMVKLAHQARTGLIVPAGVQLPVPPNGGQSGA
jgi:hypothetical protein